MGGSRIPLHKRLSLELHHAVQKQRIDEHFLHQAEVATNSAVDKINEFAEIAREQSDTLAERGKDFLSRTQRKIQSAGSASAEAADEILTTSS